MSKATPEEIQEYAQALRTVPPEVLLNRMKIIRKELKQKCGLEDICKPFLPMQFIDVGWGPKETSEDVCMLGNSLELAPCMEKPTVVFEPVPKYLFSILCVDADYGDAAYVLWFRCNISSDDHASGARDVVRWQPPRVDSASAPHRVFFFVLEQTQPKPQLTGADIIAKWSRESRSPFVMDEFLEKHHLGRIIGANCCRILGDDALSQSISAQLCDRVILDERGTKVVREERTEVKTETSVNAID